MRGEVVESADEGVRLVKFGLGRTRANAGTAVGRLDCMVERQTGGRDGGGEKEEKVLADSCVETMDRE